MAKLAEHKAQILEMWDNGEGQSRQAIANQLTEDLGETVTYQDIFRYTKKGGAESNGGGQRGRARVMIDNLETGEKIARVDYIRQQFEDGTSRGQIVKNLAELGHTVSFQIVYAATRPEQETDGEGNPIPRPEKVAKPKAAKKGRSAKAAAPSADVDSLLEEPNDDSLFPDEEEEAEAATA
jgi:hypothetical protein